MASQQSGARKKQAKNSSREEHNHPILYRHQDCIPSTKLGLDKNCERQTLLGLSNQSLECHRKVIDQEEKNFSNKSKQLNSKTKTVCQPEKTQLSVPVTAEESNETVKNNEELTKSRRRRLRKQKLQVLLAPSQPLPTKPLPPAVKSPQPKPASRPSHPTSTPALHHPSTPRVSGDSSKVPKDQRKRPDKSVIYRNKSINTKPLIDQSKADIKKILEEKALNSLLQTLVPLANTSPKKEKPPAPVFSFPDKWTNTSNSKIDNDGVFYFGETKRQLEKLTPNLKENCSGYVHNNSAFSQNSEPNIFSGGLHNSENCVSSFNFSSLDNSKFNSFPVVNQQWCNPVTVSQFSPIETVDCEKNLPVSPADHLAKDLHSSVHRDLNQLPVLEIIPNRHRVNGTHITDSPTSSVSCENNPFRTSINVDEISEKTQNTSIATLESKVRSNYSQSKYLIVDKLTQSVMKPADESGKSTKTREEIMLEREAKKAAKLAAKTKHKVSQESEQIVSSKQVLTVSSENNNKKPDQEPLVAKIQNSEATQSIQTSVVLNKEINIEDTRAQAMRGDCQDQPTSKSKAELKAERRLKQEAQRAAKTMQAKPKENVVTQDKIKQPKTESHTEQTEKKTEVAKVPVQPRPKLFSHLYQEKTHFLSNNMLKTGSLHPAVVRLGIQYGTRMVVGSNARCIALLHALKEMVNDYITPSEKEFSRGLEEELGPVTSYLHQCRPLAVSMTNALRHIKRTLTQLPNSIPDVEARRKICDVIDTYIHEQIDVAGKAICNTVKQKIADGDVILTYGCSSLVYKILVDSHISGTNFRVVIVDGLPWREGREMLRRLVEKGLSCTYVLITAASFIMREASKVLLGAHALLANGYVMSRAGSSQVALLAHCYNVPVLVCCETHKFSERVQTDAFVYNELGEMCCDSNKDKSKSRILTSLTPLSLAYDVTPPDLVSAVVTELAVLPCTSVPVILRIKPSESVM